MHARPLKTTPAFDLAVEWWWPRMNEPAIVTQTPEAVELRLVIGAEQVAALVTLVADLLRAQTRRPDRELWPEWMNVDSAAGYLDCTPERIRKLVARREIPFHQEAPGCRIFFRREELDAWMAASRRGPRT